MDLKLASLSRFTILAVAAVLCCGLYAIHWQIGFSSDTALISLIQKGIAFDGERPIFVGGAGYNGIFLEGYLGALFYHFFGVSPVVSNFAAIFYFLLFLVFFYAAVLKGFNKSIAFCSTLFFVLSGPWIYFMVARPIPNYSTTLMFGVLIFLGYAHCFNLSIRSKRSLGELMLWWGLLGGLIGFSAYTFRLTMIFTLSVMSHAVFALWLRQNPGNRAQILYAFFAPFVLVGKGWLRKSVVILSVVGWSISLIGLLSFLTNTSEYFVFGNTVRINPVNTIVLPLVALSLFQMARLVVGSFQCGTNFTLPLAAFAVGWGIGFSPNWYYYHVLGGTGGRGMALGGAIGTIGQRWDIFLVNQKNLLTLSPNSGLNIVIWSVFIFSLISVGQLVLSPLLKKALKERVELEDSLPRVLPFIFLPLVMIVAFLLSNRVLDVSSGRYLMPIMVFYALAFGVGFSQCFSWFKRSEFRTVGAGLFLIVLLSNCFAIYNNIRAHQKPAQVETLSQMLGENGFKYGFGEYWYAFAVTFFTKEQIVLAPVSSIHLHKYRKQVKGKSRLALVDSPAAQHGVVGSVVPYQGSNYRVVDIIAHSEFKIWDLRLIR